MLKKIATLLVASICVFGIAACQKNETPKTETVQTTTPADNNGATTTTTTEQHPNQ